MDECERYRQQLAERRAPAEAEAAQLIAADRYGEAEALVERVDDSTYGALAIARLYHRRLEELVALGIDDASRARAEAVYAASVARSSVSRRCGAPSSAAGGCRSPRSSPSGDTSPRPSSAR